MRPAESRDGVGNVRVHQSEIPAGTAEALEVNSSQVTVPWGLRN
jgi:hypothetical protein